METSITKQARYRLILIEPKFTIFKNSIQILRATILKTTIHLIIQSQMQFKYSVAFVTIAAENLEELVTFYTQILQKEPSHYRDGVYAEFNLEKLRLSIFKPKLEHQAEFINSGSSMSLCIEVEDLEETIASFAALGCSPPGDIIEASHGKEIYAYDPANTRLILHQSNSK